MLNEQKELLGRVITLETKVHQQEDEIVCLKSALSDVIRRLQTVETGKGLLLKHLKFCTFCNSVVKNYFFVHLQC